MSSRSFTQEEMEILRSNRYTFSVSANSISFTIEFKKEFWKRYLAREKPRNIVEALGYDYELLGTSRVSGLQAMIKKQANEGQFREGPHNSYPIYWFSTESISSVRMSMNAQPAVAGRTSHIRPVLTAVCR
jgi:hypothetical protein